MQGISLVLTTSNRNNDVVRFLESISHNYTFDVEVILLDQNSNDDLLKMVKQSVFRGVVVEYFKIPKTALSKARKFGIRKAKHDVLAFPDDDCWYDQNTLINVYNQFYREKENAVVIAKWEEHDFKYCTEVQIISQAIIKTFKTVPLSSICIFIKSSIVEKLSGFDERLGLGTMFGSGEDWDIVIRAAEFGRVIFHPQVIVHHKFFAQKSKVKSVYLREKGIGAIYVKHKIPYLVILRGLISPFFFSVKNLSLYPIYTFLGRLIGMIQWKMSIKRQSLNVSAQ